MDRRRLSALAHAPEFGPSDDGSSSPGYPVGLPNSRRPTGTHPRQEERLGFARYSCSGSGMHVIGPYS
jgi:hypothetical protein